MHTQQTFTVHSLVLAALLWLGSVSAHAIGPVTPLALYGPEAFYTVERKGKTIGHYRLQFEQQPDRLNVNVEMQLQIRVLALFNYRFDYRAQEQWTADGRLQQQQLLNTLTGEVSQLNVTELGRDTLQLGDETIVATHYQLGGDLDDTHSWYDQNGRWLGMEFSARDGSRIRVRLQEKL
jgi:hypothetical protein